MSTSNCPASNSIQEGSMVTEVVNLPPPSLEKEQQRPDQSSTCLATKLPTTQGFVDSPHDSGGQPTQLTPTVPRPSHNPKEAIGDPTTATEHQNPAQDASKNVNANVDTKGVPACDASALRAGDSEEDDCSASGYVEVSEESAGNMNQPLPPRLFAGKRIFGLKKRTEAQKRATIAQAKETNGFTDRYDYLKKYPADSPEEGMGPNARAWRVYLDEVEQFDIDMVDNFRDTVDVMLVFAGLFSAVVTTFVAQASTALQVDYTQVAASAALEQLALSRAFYSGSPIPDPSPSTLTLDSSTTTAIDRWVNGLWFTSLSLSLATALFAVLIKQWIQAYVSPVSGIPRERARIRQYRYLGLEKWHVYGIIGLLPTLLHLSLFLFLAGLAVFHFALDPTIAKVTASIAGSAATIYIFSNLAPVFDSQCPYKTPLSSYALVLLHPLVPKLRAPFRLLGPRLQALSTILGNIHRTIIAALRKLAWLMVDNSYLPRKLAQRPEQFLRRIPTGTQRSQRTSAASFTKKLELEDINLISDGIDAEALSWVATWSSNPSVRTVVVEAVGDLPIGYSDHAKDILRDGGVLKAACASLLVCTKWQDGGMRVQSGYEYPHLRAALAHFQLGLYMTVGADHSGPYASTTRACCLCMRSQWYPSHQDVDGRLAPYMSLLQEPSPELVRPQHLLQSSPQHIMQSGQFPPYHLSKMVFLLSLRRASLYLRADSCSEHRDDMVDWPSCQKLFALVQLEPPPADLFGLWQTTLVSVYLASLLPKIAPISENSGLLSKLLFNHIQLGSSELLKDLAIKLSVESCMEFLAYTLKTPATATDFLSSDGGNQLIEHLYIYLNDDQVWVSDPDKIVVGPHHALLVALLEHSEEHGASISAVLRMLTYQLGRIMMEREEPQSSDPELDLVSLHGRFLRAALIPPQLSEPYKLLESQIICLRSIFHNLPPESHSSTSLTDIFRLYDGITTLEKMIQSAGSQLNVGDMIGIEFSLEFYLKQVSPTEENSLLSPETDITQHGGQSDANSKDHLGYILRHLAQVIRICVACYPLKISHSETYSYPGTLHILRRIVKTQHKAWPEWNDSALTELESEGFALTELESEGFALPVSRWTSDDVEHNVQEIVLILRSDLEEARSPDAQDLLQPEQPLPPRSPLCVSESTETDPHPTLEPAVEEECQYPIPHAESIISRSTHRFRAAVWGVIAARRVAAGAIIPLHNSIPLADVQEDNSKHSAEGGSTMPRRDEEEGLNADASSTRPT